MWKLVEEKPVPSGALRLLKVPPPLCRCHFLARPTTLPSAYRTKPRRKETGHHSPVFLGLALNLANLARDARHFAPQRLEALCCLCARM